MKSVLLIEDSLDICELVKDGLPHYQLSVAPSLVAAEALIKQAQFDLLLLDVNLPDGDGFEFCLRLSRHLQYQDVPKILLTGKNQASEKVYGFNCGAADYITKPFNVLELRARVDRYLGRGQQKVDGDVSFPPFVFNPGFQKCWLQTPGGREDLNLTPTEFRLFLTLVKSAGQPLSRELLERAAWESRGTVIQIRGIDTHIAHLRKKLGPLGKMIESIYGHGYVFQDRAATAKAA